MFVRQIHLSILHSLRQSQERGSRISSGAENNEAYLISNLLSTPLSQPTPTGLGVIGSCSSDLFHIADWQFARLK